MNNNILFTESDFEKMKNDGMSDEDIAVLKDASAISETMDMLPDDPTELLKEIDSIMPADSKNGFKDTLSLIVKNPELATKMMAMINMVSSGVASETRLDPQIARMTDEEYAKAERKLFETITSLPADKRREFLTLMQNSTDEQKDDFYTELLK